MLELGKWQAGEAGCTERPCFFQMPCECPPLLSNRLQVYIPLPEEVCSLYEQYGENTEWYRANITVLSFAFVKKRAETNPRFVDFALTYEGMGHICVFFVDTESGLVYSRMDGGSNGYDRANNAAKHLNFVPDPNQAIDFASLLV